MSATVHGLSPSVKHVTGMSLVQLREDLPYYDGKYAKMILQEALEHCRPACQVLIRKRIEELTTEIAENTKD